MKRLTTTIMALALMLGMAQCRKNVEPLTGGQGTGEKTYVTLTVGVGGSRTEIDGYDVEWKSGDKLHVVGAKQGYLGALTTDANNTDEAVFCGEIDRLTEAQVLRFYYVGSKTFSLTGDNPTLTPSNYFQLFFACF